MTTIFTNRRLASTNLSTIGQLDAGGWDKPIYILEPGPHSAHPPVAAGDYPLELRATRGQGGPSGRYGEFMKVEALRDTIEPGLPHLVMTPDRLALIHPGNTFRDTEACSLPGLGMVTPEHSETGHYEVTRSRDALLLLYPFLRRAIENGGAIWRILDIAPAGAAAQAAKAA